MSSHRVAVILIEAENPDNIGAVCRAMKNMGLSDLRLVRPPRRWREKGKKMALGACDVLERALAFRKFDKAIEDRHVVIGTSRRWGARRGVFLPFDETIRRFRKHSGKLNTAFVFGKESKGLSNRDLAKCDWITTIPTHPSFPSINLAQAVMLVAFSLSSHETVSGNPGMTRSRKSLDHGTDSPIARVTKKEIIDVIGRLKESLISLDYQREGPMVVDRILATFYGLIKRSGLLKSEAQMFKGLARRIREQSFVKKERTT